MIEYHISGFIIVLFLEQTTPYYDVLDLKLEKSIIYFLALEPMYFFLLLLAY